MFENLRAKTYTWKLEVVFILTIHTHTHTLTRAVLET